MQTKRELNISTLFLRYGELVKFNNAWRLGLGGHGSDTN